MGLCIGLDAHARTCTYKVKDEEGRLVGSGTIPSSRDALVKMAKTYPGAPVILEASSVSEWIYDALTEQGTQVVPVHPTNIRRLLGKKNDDIDAGFLVDAHRVKALPTCYVPSKPLREMREVVRCRAFLVQERTRLKNRVRSVLLRKGVRVQGSVAAKKRRAELKRVNPEVGVLLRLVDDVDEQLHAADKKVEALGQENEEVVRLRSIPGFGPLVALGVYAELGDVTRFQNARQVAAYFGLVPSESQSGDSLTRGHLTKRGSNTARWLPTQAAWSHLRSAPKSSIAKHYTCLAKRVGKKRAITMVARKLAVVAFVLLREKRTFTLNG